MRPLVVAAVLLSAPAAAAQNDAFCALRDPVAQIYDLFPTATGFRSIVRPVGEAARDHVLATVPFEMHFNEMGRHTLYAALRDGQPIGWVHVRSESGEWGLMEFVWALDLDLRVRDFAFQRYRGRAPRGELQATLRHAVLGKSADELAVLLIAAANGDYRLDRFNGWVRPVLRSALKTIAVTEFVWAPEVERPRAAVTRKDPR